MPIARIHPLWLACLLPFRVATPADAQQTPPPTGDSVAHGSSQARQPSHPGVDDILALPATPADLRVAYGPGPSQFGELRLPEGSGPFPVAIIIHGGCWSAAYGLNLMDAMATALTRKGVATWNLEYRRVGDPAGGWPGTFRDVAAGADRLRELATRFPLDLDSVIAIGHSAGGQLALWLAARDQLPEGSPLTAGTPLPLVGVINLAGITDLESYLVRDAKPGECGANVDELVGGLPEDVPERYRQASPIALLPLGVPQVHITGAEDGIVPVEHGAPFRARATRLGDELRAFVVPGAAHFELIAPGTAAWERVEAEVFSLLNRARQGLDALPPAHRRHDGHRGAVGNIRLEPTQVPDALFPHEHIHVLPHLAALVQYPVHQRGVPLRDGGERLAHGAAAVVAYEFRVPVRVFDEGSREMNGGGHGVGSVSVQAGFTRAPARRP